ncbi:MAG: DNA helicase UvrD [Nitrospirae bacterium]|nr:DNA helicase UvrD [Nitrospirota bacterium]
MPFIADLHIHSKYSRATSKDMSPESIWRWAQLKGITVIGTGDFTHPEWTRELREKLEPAGNGLFTLKEKFRAVDVPGPCSADVMFLLSAEISCIYGKNGKTRKVHSIILAPDFDDVARINLALSKIGNLSSDGRPILGLDAKELLRIALEAAPDSMLVPAHAWTPHFSVFGAASGFDALEDCFEELTPHIYALETGLSSDPAMNRRLSALDGLTLISNSDAHSPAKIGREASVFNTAVSYNGIIDALKKKKGFAGTIEFFPEEGKYHHDGHRLCNVSFSPEETIRHNYLCPVCGKKVTVGVMHRVELLADRPEGAGPGAPFHSIIPLTEIIAETLKVGVNSKAVDKVYQKLLQELGNEFNILMEVPLGDIEKAGSPVLREAVSRMRAGNVNIAPGYDGEYGKVKIFETFKKKEVKGQRRLF